MAQKKQQEESKPRKKREPKPKGLCIFCHKGFYNEDGGVVGQVGNVKRPDHAVEWFHMDCYEDWRDTVRSGK